MVYEYQIAYVIKRDVLLRPSVKTLQQLVGKYRSENVDESEINSLEPGRLH